QTGQRTKSDVSLSRPGDPDVTRPTWPSQDRNLARLAPLQQRPPPNPATSPRTSPASRPTHTPPTRASRRELAAMHAGTLRLPPSAALRLLSGVRQPLRQPVHRERRVWRMAPEAGVVVSSRPSGRGRFPTSPSHHRFFVR